MKFIKQLANRLTMTPVIATTLAMLSLLAPVATTQAVEIKADQYQAFYGDVNGDGLHDIYLAPKPKYIPIATDVMVIIPIAGDGNAYKLLAQASGYAAPELDNGIDTNTLNAGHFQLLSGDFNGDGLADVFIQSTSQSLLSLTLANTLLDPPYILQSFASFGRDTHELTIGDINNDGRDDITYTVNNQSHTLHATNQGHLTNDGQAQVTANYGYDYLNKRRYKVVEQIGEPRKEVLYIDDNTELRNGKLQKYITLGGQKVARSSQAGGEFSPTEFYLNNHLGSIALTLDASAHVKNAFTYEPYGDKQIAYGETQASPYGFTGKEQDPETQLGYFHHRYLNTQIGQFITPDPVFAMDNRFTDPQLWSPYAYGRNNPIVYVDPDGQRAQSLFFFIAKDPSRAAKLTARSVRGLIKGNSIIANNNQLAENSSSEENAHSDAPDISGDLVDDLISSSPDQGKKEQKKRDKGKGRAISERELDITDMDDAKAAADKAYDALGLKGVKDIETEKFGKGRNGEDSNGRSVIVRPSADGRPTIEVQPVKGSGSATEEIRFGSRDLQGYNR